MFPYYQQQYDQYGNQSSSICSSMYAELHYDVTHELDFQLKSKEKLRRLLQMSESQRKRCFRWEARCNALERAIHLAKSDAKMYLLAMCAARYANEDDQYAYIPDEDRAIVNEAIYAKLDPKYIELLFEDHGRACEWGGIVDHINHPIHFACRLHPKAVRTILNVYPDCATQRNEDGKLPLEIFFDNGFLGGISREDYIRTINQFSTIDQFATKEVFSQIRAHPSTAKI